MEFDDLFGKLVELGYHCDLVPSREYPYGASSANLIMEYYKKNGCLNGCDLLEDRHRNALDKWYRKPILLDSWPGGLAGSGTTFDWSELPRYDNYRRGPGISG